jgi:hypothetical protein
MADTINFYRKNAALEVNGSAIEGCSSARIWRIRQASPSIFGIRGASL